MNRTSKILAFALQAIFLSTPVFAAMESDGVVADGGCMNENTPNDMDGCIEPTTHQLVS